MDAGNINRPIDDNDDNYEDDNDNDYADNNDNGGDDDYMMAR